jgi:FAD/FMN-containing dehydrogenase/Fe-S oxidoreductase
MATESSGPGASAGEPTDVADPEHEELAAALRERVAGAVRFDDYSQVLYATDGSVYGARPAGVVVPRDEADVRAAVEAAADHDTPILPRGAGSSLAGQSVGPGCVVLDLSTHMDGVVDVDPEARTARVQPGVVQDDLDDRLADHGLKFAPDPASSNRATVGGGIGNNSTGAHSVRYGITDAYVDAVRVVLADGTVAEFGEVVLDSPAWEDLLARDDRVADLHRTVRDVVEENEAEIEARYPDLKRTVSGYNLDRVVYETESGERAMNLAKLVVGAEGTLGVVVAADLSLVTVPEETALGVYCFGDLTAAMRAVPRALDREASAVELMDDELFRLARDAPEFAEYAEPIPDDAAAALMVEFDSDLHDDLRAAVGETTDAFVHGGEAFEAIEAFDSDQQASLWKLRKAAIPLLMSLPGDAKPYPFIEDATVPPAELAEYVESFEGILDDHGTSAAYFAHAGAGTLHIRPVLSLKEEDGIETMRAIADDVTDLVLDHHGSFSGEHGDGLARTSFNPKMYGPDLWAAFREVKSAFDPDWLLNPGKVVYREDDPTRMDEHLRYGPAYSSVEPNTELDFSDEGGFSHLVELCNGCGTCRQTDTGTMCPTYRASREEIQTTRGRANLLRAAISGDLPEEELYTERFQSEVLDLCVGCKGCASDCPTGVDMAKLKAESKHAYHEREGVSLRERLFSNVDRVASVGSALAPVSNWLSSLPGADALAERLLGFARERDPPTFTRRTLERWLRTREPAVAAEEATHRVLLFPDTYTNYTNPEPGRAAVRALEAAGCHVRLATDVAPSGRAAFSTGRLDLARERAERNVEALAPRVRDGWSVVFVEPSDAVMFQDEYADLLSGEATLEVGASAYGVMEFLDTHRLDEELAVDATGRLAYHGHCNQAALARDHHAAAVLDRLGYDVDALDTGCCGMAGSFGYEAEHYDLSMAIGERMIERVEGRGEVVAPGASCRTQLGDRDGESPPPHPVEKVAEALDAG